MFNRLGRRIAYDLDVYDVQRMFVASGLLGSVLNKEGKYVTGLFEYTGMTKLFPNSDDILCFHPSFCEYYNLPRTFHSRKKRLIGADFEIYPYGANVFAEDKRIIWVQQMH